MLIAINEGINVNSTFKKTCMAVCLLGLASAALALPPDFMQKMNAESRPMEDRMRDGARRPYQVMEELGVKEGMTALDVGAGGGWFTRVLSAAVGPKGKVISQFGPRALQTNNGQAQKDIAASLGNAEAYFGAIAELPANSVDVAVTALNMHHGNAERNVPYLKEILNVLKPGGQVAVIDHQGRMGQDNAKMHRMMDTDAKKWLQDAGFEIVKESNILRQNADDHTLPIDDPRLARATDQFLFIARKPAR
jgi:predicted methyltransferase